MKNHLYTWALILVMGSGYAFTQSQYPGQNPPAVPQTQQPPTQQPPTTDQGTADQTKASGGDVQKDIQTALQKDQSLASANIAFKRLPRTLNYPAASQRKPRRTELNRLPVRTPAACL